MKSVLTKKQRLILNYITSFLKSRGYAPSYREIANKFKLSSISTIHQYIQTLQSKGYLQSSSGKRSLNPTTNLSSPHEGIIEIPLVGLITAGQPIEALVEHEKLQVPQSLTGRGHYYSLKVKGESMIEDGIYDGDYVVVEEADSANNGDIVVALLENQFATLKRYYKEKDHIRLQPANSNMEPFRVKKVKIQGKVVGLIRRYR